MPELHDRTPGTADLAARFASDLIRIDTTNRGGGDAQERPTAEYVAARLTEAGWNRSCLSPRPAARTWWPGSAAPGMGLGGGGGALLLHGHLDVVPADPAAWSVHPFSGEIRDGVLWGRGAVDMKNADAVLLPLVTQWARDGRRPRRDLVLAFAEPLREGAQCTWTLKVHGSKRLGWAHQRIDEEQPCQGSPRTWTSSSWAAARLARPMRGSSPTPARGPAS